MSFPFPRPFPGPSAVSAASAPIGDIEIITRSSDTILTRSGATIIARTA